MTLILRAMTDMVVGQRLAGWPTDKTSVACLLSGARFRAAEILEHIDEVMVLAGVTDPAPADPMLAAVRAMQEGHRLYNEEADDGMDNAACDALAERTYVPPMNVLLAGVETRTIFGAAAAIDLANKEGGGSITEAVLASVARYFEPILAITPRPDLLAEKDAVDVAR